MIHAFNMPDFTIMMDAVPGRVNAIWLVPDQSGEYLIQCREYCGTDHHKTRAKLIVEEPVKLSKLRLERMVRKFEDCPGGPDSISTGIFSLDQTTFIAWI